MVTIKEQVQHCGNCSDVVMEKEEPRTGHTYYVHLADGELWCNPTGHLAATPKGGPLDVGPR